MCLAFPGKVIKIEGQKVTVQYPQEVREVLLGGEKVKVGDYVLVQMGVVVKSLTAKEYKVSSEAWGAQS